MPDLESLVDKGQWDQIPLMRDGKRHSKFSWEVIYPFFMPNLTKKLNYILDKYSQVLPQGVLEISTLAALSHVKPHCGPTNHRLRFHLGVVVPDVSDLTNLLLLPSHTAPTSPLPCFIRVGKEQRTWEEGKVLIFDDSFEHEVGNSAPSDRIILLLDVWHPYFKDKDKELVREHFKFSAGRYNLP